MSVQMIITLAVFLFMIISFSMNKLPMALTSIVGMLVLWIPRLLWATWAAIPLSR